MFHGSHDVQDKADVQTKFTYLLCHYIFLLLPCFTMFLLIHWTSTNFRWIPIRMIITKSPDSYRLSDNQTKIYSASLANVIKLTYLFTFSTWVLVPCIGLAYHSIFLSHTRICYQDNLWRPITWWTNEWSWAMFRLNPLHWSYCISNCSLLYKNKRICFIRKMWLRITWLLKIASWRIVLVTILKLDNGLSVLGWPLIWPPLPLGDDLWKKPNRYLWLNCKPSNKWNILTGKLNFSHVVI